MSQIDARIRELEKGETRSGLIAHIDPSTCNGCGRCLSGCATGAIAIVDDIAHVDVPKCNGCGQCVTLCPRDAVDLRKG
jgi:MinD superfamily P-loop ATPase